MFYQTCDDEPSDTPKLNKEVPVSKIKDEVKKSDEPMEITAEINKGQANETKGKSDKTGGDSERKDTNLMEDFAAQ